MDKDSNPANAVIFPGKVKLSDIHFWHCGKVYDSDECKFGGIMVTENRHENQRVILVCVGDTEKMN